MRLRIESPSTLFEALRRALPEWKSATIKQRLRFGGVAVNGEPTRHGHQPVSPGDTVDIGSAPAASRADTPPFPILYEDEHIVVVDKPSGLRSVSDAAETEQTVPMLLKRYFTARGDRQPGCWVVHRLDRETSGVLALARSREAKRALVLRWSHAEKTYAALTVGIPDPPEGTIDQPLREAAGLFVRASRAPDARDAVTRYRVREASRALALVDVFPETGRKHQIRVHLAWLGCPVLGDDRYAEPGSGPHLPAAARRLYLHAAALAIPHPVTGARIACASPLPEVFLHTLRHRS